MSSDLLFASPSLLSGIARALDLWGRFDRYNESRTPEEADVKALVSDWMVVRSDLHEALRRVLAEHPELVREVESIDQCLRESPDRGKLSEPSAVSRVNE